MSVAVRGGSPIPSACIAGCDVTGIDFNAVAVDRAGDVARELGLLNKFEVADLFLYRPSALFDVVVSLGVLHHTDNCAAAVRRVCEFVKPGGHVFIGLYHKFGRQPFLDHFREMRRAGASEEAMLERYRQLHSNFDDETMLRSWFRDQVLHPRGTQHTLEEMIPVIAQAGMQLVSTSINRFGPVNSLKKLYAEEKKLKQVGEERLRQNQYFTGFFVFLAQKPESGAGGQDTKTYVEHDPKLGYRYVANLDLTLPRPGGGSYHLQTNSLGLRSSREYAFKKPPHVTRLILCGDSMSAGQYVSNEQRLSEQLERIVPNLEVVNLSLEGSGTDQQLLLYEDVGQRFEHDLVVLMPFLSNLRRNMVDAREAVEPGTGRSVLRGKPRFELVDGELELRNVPVPENLGAAADGAVNIDTDLGFVAGAKARLSALPGAALSKHLIYALAPGSRFPSFATRIRRNGG